MNVWENEGAERGKKGKKWKNNRAKTGGAVGLSATWFGSWIDSQCEHQHCKWQGTPTNTHSHLHTSSIVSWALASFSSKSPKTSKKKTRLYFSFGCQTSASLQNADGVGGICAKKMWQRKVKIRKKDSIQTAWSEIHTLAHSGVKQLGERRRWCMRTLKRFRVNYCDAGRWWRRGGSRGTRLIDWLISFLTHRDLLTSKYGALEQFA